MLKCKEVDQQISFLIDGQLNWRQKLSLNSHLMMCKNCRRLSKYFKQSNQQIQAQTAKEAEPQDVEKIMSAINNQK